VITPESGVGTFRRLCADVQGFSLHAAVRCGANDRQTLEQLCHHITRPALANERMLCNAAGQVVLKRKTPWRFSTTNLVMSRMEFMQQSTLQAPGNDARASDCFKAINSGLRMTLEGRRRVLDSVIAWP